MYQPTCLFDVYHFASDHQTYKSWIRQRIAKIILTSSVIRVFKPNTKTGLIKCLGSIPINEILEITNKEDYDDWHSRQVDKVFNCLVQYGNRDKIENEEGLKFGHSCKIFNLYIGHLVFFSPYFEAENVIQIKHFLHMPLDKKVFDALRECNVSRIPSSIKSVTETTYKSLQNHFRESARELELPPIYFDEYAWALDKN